MESRLRFYSYGYVAEAKDISSDEVEVYPVEVLPHHDGSIATAFNSLSASGVDGDGKPYQVSVTEGHTIRAKWLDFNGGNRVTPPDVRRGEEVMLMIFSGCGQYYWIPTGRNKSLRRLETVKYRFSATTDESVTELDDSNSYVVEISSHNKTIKLFTSKDNGEFCRYAFSFDMEEGKVELQDDIGNHALLDSKNTVIEFENADGSILSLTKKAIRMYAEDSVDVETKRYGLKCETNSQEASKSTTVNSGGSTSMNSSSLAVNANTSVNGSLTNNNVNVGSTHKHDGVVPGTSSTKTAEGN